MMEAINPETIDLLVVPSLPLTHRRQLTGYQAIYNVLNKNIILVYQQSEELHSVRV